MNMMKPPQQLFSITDSPKRRSCSLLHVILACSFFVNLSCSYLPSSRLSLRTRFSRGTLCKLDAAPKRLEENVDGLLYVNDRCINCAACSNFCQDIFKRDPNIYKHVVYKQPTIKHREELEAARAALAACPVAAIRVETNVDDEKDGHELKDALSLQHGQPFPQSIYPMKSAEGESVDIGVYYLGHHNDASFGAIPYLILGKSPSGKDISVMVDVPRFSPSAVRALKSLSASPDYMFLTHVDDTADHNKWKEEFPTLKRIFHAGDLGRHNWVGDLTLENVEILLRDQTDRNGNESITVWDIDGNPQPFSGMLKEEGFLIIHTPGHSPGSISLLFRPKLQQNLDFVSSNGNNKVKYPNGVLFTGDTYSWTTRDGGHMSGFPRYGNNLLVQAETLQKLGNISHMWDIVAPGHGHIRSYLEIHENEDIELNGMKLSEMDDALEELWSYK